MLSPPLSRRQSSTPAGSSRDFIKTPSRHSLKTQAPYFGRRAGVPGVPCLRHPTFGDAHLNHSSGTQHSGESFLRHPTFHSAPYFGADAYLNHSSGTQHWGSSRPRLDRRHLCDRTKARASPSRDEADDPTSRNQTHRRRFLRVVRQGIGARPRRDAHCQGNRLRSKPKGGSRTVSWQRPPAGAQQLE